MSVSSISTAHSSVWIGCLSCYNAGLLVGEWHNVEDTSEVTPDDLHDQPTSYEELLCFDHEGFSKDTGEILTHTAPLWGELYDEVGENNDLLSLLGSKMEVTQWT